MKIIAHIGLPKTGTSFLQEAIFNREISNVENLTVTDFPDPDSHHILAATLGSKNAIKKYHITLELDRAIKNINKQIAEHKNTESIFFLSSEFFSMFYPLYLLSSLTKSANFYTMKLKVRSSVQLDHL